MTTLMYRNAFYRSLLHSVILSVFVFFPGITFAQPIFTKSGDAQVNNLSAQILSPKAGLFMNMGKISQLETSPSQLCAFNRDIDGSTNGAYGNICIFSREQSSAYTFPAQFGVISQTYANSKQTPNTNIGGLYTESILNAYSPSGWGINPLVTMKRNSGGGIAIESDLTNQMGCDAVGIDRNSTGGTASWKGTRDDGSACPDSYNLLLEGVASSTASAAIDVSYVSAGDHDMYQDVIRIIGGNAAAEYEWVSNTAAYTPFEIKGVHGGYGIDLANGQYAAGALALSNTPQAEITWRTDGAQWGGYTRGYVLQPRSDNTMGFTGSLSVATNNFNDPQPGTTRDLKIGDQGFAWRGGAYGDTLTTSGQVAANNIAIASDIYMHSAGYSDVDLYNNSGVLNSSGNIKVQGALEATTGLKSDADIITTGQFTGNSVAVNAAIYLHAAGSSDASLSNSAGVLVSSSNAKVNGNLQTVGDTTIGGTLYAAAIAAPGQGAAVTTATPIVAVRVTLAAAPACSATLEGASVYFTDGRKSGETAGQGSGTLALCTHLAKGGAFAWWNSATGTAVTN